MARTLGGIALPDGSGQHGSMEWTDRHNWQPVAQASTRTLSGALVLWERGLSEGRPITLEARERVCWLATATVEALQALAATPGGTHTLVWNAESYRVAFRRDAGAALEFSPVLPHAALHFGRINLVTV